MAWTTPGTAVAGDVLTAAFWNTNVRDNSIMGSPVYTNEAARDAAIPTPTEGMQCYLTAPTVPAATGSVTALPSGIKTIYNGSVWVCLTPIGAHSNTSATTTSASYVTTLTGDATAISVTIVTGTTARIMFNAAATNSNSGVNVYQTYSVSGATTIAAADANGSFFTCISGTGVLAIARSYIVTGLTAGTNTFTLNYRTSTNTATFSTRNLCVEGIA